jgi:hypothetical protein
MRLIRLYTPITLAVLLATSYSHAQDVHETKIELGQYGFVKTNCAWRRDEIEFLDNEHLALIAPTLTNCNKSLWDSPVDTTISVIDLQGRRVASSHRSDVIRTSAGPANSLAVCVGDRIEFLSSSLAISASFPLPERETISRCSYFGGLSASRDALAIPGEGHWELFRLPPSASTLIAVSKGLNVRAVADDGLLLCKNQRCEIVGASGVTQNFPSLPDTSFQSDIVGLITKDKVLVADRSGKQLYTLTPSGDKATIADLTSTKPPFINSRDIRMSASEPRRVLYSVEGCLLGDFDDCYGAVFHRFAVFDSSDGRLILRHHYAADATLRISPDGHTVIEQDGTVLHVFDLP